MEKLNGNTFFKPNSKLIDEMTKTFYSCEQAVRYSKNLGIPENEVEKHIDIFYEFARDINYCSKCPGMKNCKKDNPTLCTKISYANGIVERQFTPCKKVLERMTFEAQFVIQDFDDEWLESSLKGLDKTVARSDVITKYLNYKNKGDASWIYISGEQNTGRSFVAATLAVDLAHKEKGPIAFINASKRFKQLADFNFKNPEKFNKYMDIYQNCSVLVIDDFGNEYKNDIVRDAIVYEILAKRASNKLFTIITSDFSIDEIVTLYGTNRSAAIRARQIGKILTANADQEISLGAVSVY